jgi:N-acetylmuramoyl-L-alanine amidase
MSSKPAILAKGGMVVTNSRSGHQTPAMPCIARFVLFGALIAFCAIEVHAASLREEQHCLALALYWEARGEGRSGMVAVGWTILNRVDSRDFPATPCEVVFQGGEQPPCEFSWWCDGKSDRPRERRSWHLALLIAAELLLDPPPDPTGGSLYYHSTSIRSSWHRQRVRTARISQHVFYR